MTDNNMFGRRAFAKGALAVGTSFVVAGCTDAINNLPQSNSTGDGVGGGGTDGSSGGGGTTNQTGADVEGSSLSYGDSVDGELTTSSPTEPQYGDPAVAFTFEGSQGDVAIITMSSSAFDTYVLLGGPDGSIIQENDDGRTGTNSRMARLLPQDGTYTIWASSFSGTGTGSFTLSLSQGSQSDIVPNNASSISYGDTVEGELSSSAPTDPYFGDPGVPYTFEGSQGDSITVTMNSDPIDPYLVITDENGSLVEQNDDGGEGLNSQLTTSLPADGTYVIWAESALGEETGSFTLTLEGP